MSELPCGWQWAVLGELISSIEAGKSFRCEERPPLGSEPGLVKISAVTKGIFNEGQSKTVLDLDLLNEGARISAGDFLMSRANTIDLVGACAVVGRLQRNLYLSDKVLRLRMPDEFKAWVLNWLKTERGRAEIEARSSGNQLSMRNIGQDSIRSIPIPVPPCAEKAHIVKKIEALTTRSRRAREALDTLPALIDRYRQSILAAAFRGDLTAEWRAQHPDHETAEDFLSRIGVIASEVESEDVPLELPATWKWACLADIADVKGGLAKGKKRTEGVVLHSVPYLRVANVQRGYLDLSEVKEIEASQDEIDQLRLIKGDILFNEGGDRDKLGRGWVWGDEIGTCIHQNHVFRARRRAPDINPFLISYFGNTFGQRYFFGKGTQSVNLASISLSKLRAFPVPIIPPAEQVVLHDRIQQALRRVELFHAAWRSASERLPTLDQSILAKAFRGELVPQDPNDEPASVLLERIRAERAAAGPAPRRGRRPKVASGG